ncbi:MAG TPA: hypothetical protein VLK33_14560, partial [Terriglobales bacterium]|nr:hypothetical protein [Terriglobales bacterium]
MPGPEGEPGTDGAAGLNAFTITTADFDIPNIGDQVTVQVGNSSWAVVGQNVFVAGAGTFSVSSKPGTGSMILQYLDYAGNTHAGETISAGAGVSPAGTQPAITLLPAIPNYQLGGSQVLTDSSVQLLGASVVLAAKTYLLMATFRLDYEVATFADPETIELKLRETANGPADIANAVVNLQTPTVTAKTGTFIQGAFPPVTYQAADGDTIEMFGSIAVTPYSGSMQAI